VAAITFEGVRKAYGAAVAVAGLDLALRDGEFVSLLGPSGCGKTTTLRMLAGLETPTAGRILIGDRVVNDVPPSRRDVAMVFQSYALYPHMNVRENIAYPLKKRGVREPERSERVMAAARSLGLEALLSRKPRQLSGGQQQRVALGRALVREPQVFLLDEPLSNLDAKLRAHMRAELIELHGRIGRTMVYVTHDQLEAMTMSTRIAVLHQGELQQFGSPSEIYARPANVTVAGFVGTPAMTLAPAAIDGSTLRFGGLPIDLPEGHLARPAGSVTAGIRPEDVIVGEGPGTALVKVVEPTGHEQIVLLGAGGVILTARVRNDCPLKAGERVPVRLDVAKLHVFDTETGRRLNADRPARNDADRPGPAFAAPYARHA